MKPGTYWKKLSEPADRQLQYQEQSRGNPKEQEGGPIDLLEWAWSIIANAGGGDWERESKEWQGAAAKWRDTYHSSLSLRHGDSVVPVEVDEIPEVKEARELSDARDRLLATTETALENLRESSDPWHPASEPPKPEDFEPTTKVLIVNTKTEHSTAVDEERIKMFNWTHWRKITPPE